jgi:hypothetical protein
MTQECTAKSWARTGSCKGRTEDPRVLEIRGSPHVEITPSNRIERSNSGSVSVGQPEVWEWVQGESDISDGRLTWSQTRNHWHLECRLLMCVAGTSELWRYSAWLS